MEKIKSKKGEVLMGAAFGIMQSVVVSILSLSMIIGASSQNTIKNANFAMFVMELGNYNDEIKIKSAEVMLESATNGKTINYAQRIYLTANGICEYEEMEKSDVYDMMIPAGYVIPESIKNALKINEDSTVAYLIDDSKIPGYENFGNFTSEKNEYHLTTSDGEIFVIPGFAQKQDDGSIRYYITSSGKYYTVVGDSKQKVSVENSIEKDPINKNDFKNIYGVTIDNKEVKNSPIYKSNLVRK